MFKQRPEDKNVDEEERELKYVSTKTILTVAIAGIFLITAILSAANTAYGDNIVYQNYSNAQAKGCDIFGFVLAETSVKWIFAVDESTNTFYLQNQNTQLQLSGWASFGYDYAFKGGVSSITSHELYANYDWVLSGPINSISGSTQNQVSLNPGNDVQIYMWIYGVTHNWNYNTLPITLDFSD